MQHLIGHLHPLVVHLPIGFIILAIITDWYGRNNTQERFGNLSVFLWLLVALSSISAVITGLVLIDSGHYEGLNVFIHRWTAIGIAVISSLIFLCKWKSINYFKHQEISMKFLCVVLLIIAGHNGGEITHGSGYLSLVPQKAQPIQWNIAHSIDSIQLYKDILQPVFESKCIRCHEEGDERGRLNLQSQEGMLSDVFGDPGIMPGDLSKSEIFKRVTLSQGHEKFMPPSGPALTYAEIRVLEFWISEGASFTGLLGNQEQIPKDIKNILTINYDLDFEEKSFYDRLTVDHASEEDIRTLQLSDYNVKSIAADHALLDVNKTGLGDKISKNQMEQLLRIKNQITWLDLSQTDVTDEIGEILLQMPNLTKLKLQNTDVGDEVARNLINHKQLKTINLYDTKLSDAGLLDLGKITSLRSLYIWQTNVTNAAVEELKSSRPDLKIVGNLSTTESVE